MNLEISSFADAGELEKERLVLKVTADIDIGAYVAISSIVSSVGYPSSGRNDVYWFPDADVKAGDLVVLYTKQGATSTKDLEQGRKAYFYYWGKKEALWGSGRYTAVILRVAEWVHKTPKQK